MLSGLLRQSLVDQCLGLERAVALQQQVGLRQRQPRPVVVGLVGGCRQQRHAGVQVALLRQQARPSQQRIEIVFAGLDPGVVVDRLQRIASVFRELAR